MVLGALLVCHELLISYELGAWHDLGLRTYPQLCYAFPWCHVQCTIAVATWRHARIGLGHLYCYLCKHVDGLPVPEASV